MSGFVLGPMGEFFIPSSSFGPDYPLALRACLESFDFVNFETSFLVKQLLTF
jgi:hypothetical protein